MKNDLAQVPFYAYESALARAERTQKRLIGAVVASMAVSIGCIIMTVRKGI